MSCHCSNVPVFILRTEPSVDALCNNAMKEDSISSGEENLLWNCYDKRANARSSQLHSGLS